METEHSIRKARRLILLPELAQRMVDPVLHAQGIRSHSSHGCSQLLGMWNVCCDDDQQAGGKHRRDVRKYLFCKHQKLLCSTSCCIAASLLALGATHRPAVYFPVPSSRAQTFLHACIDPCCTLSVVLSVFVSRGSLVFA